MFVQSLVCGPWTRVEKLLRLRFPLGPCLVFIASLKVPWSNLCYSKWPQVSSTKLLKVISCSGFLRPHLNNVVSHAKGCRSDTRSSHSCLFFSSFFSSTKRGICPETLTCWSRSLLCIWVISPAAASSLEDSQDWFSNFSRVWNICVTGNAHTHPRKVMLLILEIFWALFGFLWRRPGLKAVASLSVAPWCPLFHCCPPCFSAHLVFVYIWNGKCCFKQATLSPCVFLLSAADVGVAQLVRRSGWPVDRRALGSPAASCVPLQPGHAAAVRGGVWR